MKLGCPMYSKQANEIWSLKSLVMLNARLELAYMQYRLCFFIRFIVGRKIDRNCPYRKRTRSARTNFKVLVTKLDWVESKRTKIRTEINIPPKIYKKKQSCRTESIEIGVYEHSRFSSNSIENNVTTTMKYSFSIILAYNKR